MTRLIVFAFPIINKISFTSYETVFQNRFFLCAIILAAGCDENSPVAPEVNRAGVVTLVRNLDADTLNVGRFTYFRLRDSTVVTGADTASVNWDIAFRATTLIINGGPIRNGGGGAQILSGTEFSTLTAVPEGGWRVDSSASNLAIPVGSGRAWYNYNPATNVISTIPGVVIGLRTGDGKFAKLQILSYYLNAPQTPNGFTDRARVYTFRYQYQPNGTRSFN